MNCGLEYTSFPLFKDIKAYSRYQHSIGVSLIIYHFTKDLKQALAGLFHDIATPAFAHVIDFLNHDYLIQESTEELTKDIILSDQDILTFINHHHITIEEICDYHIYSIADNHSPKLCADRLEYTLGNSVNYGFSDLDTIKRIYDDLIIGYNEDDEEEIMFQTKEIALEFSLLSLKCSKVYVADNDRYSMEYLARLLKEAIELKILSENDLYITETNVIQKLEKDSFFKEQWDHFKKLNTMEISKEEKEGYLKIKAKKRYIDPYIVNIGRVSQIYPDYKQQLLAFTNNDFDYYIKGVVK